MVSLRGSGTPATCGNFSRDDRPAQGHPAEAGRGGGRRTHDQVCHRVYAIATFFAAVHLVINGPQPPTLNVRATVVIGGKADVP